MSFQMKILGFICICLGISILARILPVPEITRKITPTSTQETLVTAPVQINPTLLQQQYNQRPVFASKLETTLGTAAPLSPLPTHEWSPLDYDLIGVSRSGGQRTGWFKHKNTGTLISARQGTRLGDWLLNQLSTTEARLENNGDKLSLKLFIDEEPR